MAAYPPVLVPSNHMKVVVRLRRRVWVDRLYDLLEGHQREQATYPAAIEHEQAELLVGYGRRAAAAVGLMLYQ